LLALGLIGEYIGKIYKEVKQRPLYVIEKEALASMPVIKEHLPAETVSARR
jgi:hypothetical protein